MKVLIVGQAPNKTGDHKKILLGSAGRKISKLLGITQLDYANEFDRVNLFRSWPGKKGKGDTFPMRAAEFRASKMMRSAEFRCRSFVILLGKNVARAFGHRGDYFELGFLRGRTMCVTLPHTSGVNLWWNDSKNLTRGRKIMRSMLGSSKVRAR